MKCYVTAYMETNALYKSFCSCTVLVTYDGGDPIGLCNMVTDYNNFLPY